ncbi:MAG: UDP-N-acetylglucosamine 1-carboxyvinyltransferase [candidate division Zixibacteria bacterium]
MDKFIVNGGKRLSGKIRISGSKNAALPIIVASLLAESGRSVIGNVPNLMDIRTIIGVVEELGAKVEYNPKSETMIVDSSNIDNHDAPYDLVRKMRASFLVLGPLLGRLGKARVSLPGGCVLGARPVDQHIEGFKRLGAKISERSGYVTASAKTLSGNDVFFDRPSHTGTENIMMAAVLAKGKTTIINAACDPEVVDLANFLNMMGAKIRGAGTTRIEITGVKKLKGAEYNVMSDRLEAGTFILAVGACGGKIELTKTNPKDNEILISKLSSAGLTFKSSRNRIIVSRQGRPRPIRVTTYPFPGFPTDLQAAIMAFAIVGKGTSYVREMVFTDRFTHVMEMQRLGADITISGDEAVINGVDTLTGASIMASDIRAGAGLVLACLAAKGESEILRVYHIDRGYEKIERKLQALRGNIIRVSG